MNLFDFLYRGATVYLACGHIYAEAERRTNLFVMPRRNSICGPQGRIAQKPSAMQALLAIALGATAYVKKGAIQMI